jgi:two-component system cell cycle response regulator DivK
MIHTCVIADADPFIAHLLQRFAEQSGLRAIHTQVGQDVLDLARQSRPDVIIVEPELPGKLRGWEIVRTLRMDQDTCAIPIITCSWMEDAEVLALVGEVQSNLRKPNLHYEDFLRALAQAGVEVGRHSASQG